MVVLNILIFTPNLGKIDQFWRAYVSNGWFNHQLVKMTTWKRCSTHFPPIFNLFLPHGSIWFHHFLRLPSSASIKSGRTGATVELHERWRNTGYLPSTRAGGHGSGWWYDDVCRFGLRHAMRHRMAWWMHDISDVSSTGRERKTNQNTSRLYAWFHECTLEFQYSKLQRSFQMMTTSLHSIRDIVLTWIKLRLISMRCNVGKMLGRLVVFVGYWGVPIEIVPAEGRINVGSKLVLGKYSVYHSTGHVFKKLHTVILLFAVQYVHLFNKLSYVLNLACQKNSQGIITKKAPQTFP